MKADRFSHDGSVPREAEAIHLAICGGSPDTVDVARRT